MQQRTTWHGTRYDFANGLRELEAFCSVSGWHGQRMNTLWQRLCGPMLWSSWQTAHHLLQNIAGRLLCRSQSQSSRNQCKCQMINDLPNAKWFATCHMPHAKCKFQSVMCDVSCDVSCGQIISEPNGEFNNHQPNVTTTATVQSCTA